MQKVMWQKKDAKKNVLGNLMIMVPTVDEICSLPRTGNGWCLMAIVALMIRAAKVDAASKFMTLIKGGMCRADAEKKISTTYVPGVTYEVDMQATVDRAKREQLIKIAEKMKERGKSVDDITDVISADANEATVFSVLCAVGLAEDEEEEE